MYVAVVQTEVSFRTSQRLCEKQQILCRNYLNGQNISKTVENNETGPATLNKTMTVVLKCYSMAKAMFRLT